ncbi:hypothetical protein GC194_04300 [bacterium]|nr:hypothetical protein [bacterium]
MKARYLYLLPALAFLAFALLQLGQSDPLFWFGIYMYLAICNVLALMKRLSYLLIVLGFSLLLLFITSNFPPIEKWSLQTEEGQRIIGLIVSCNYMGFLGIIKLYNDSYK